MADQVEITNVGDDGVASELTLERLVKTMEKFAKTSGLDPKSQAAKAQKAHTDAVNSEIEVIRKNVEAKKDFNAALKDGTSSLNRFSRGLLGIASQVVGQLTGSAIGLSKELNKGSTALTDYAQHLPVVGERLSQVTGILDETYGAFQTMAKAGGSFSYDLVEMRAIAKDAGMNLSEFSMFVTQSSQDLAGLGGTVSQGAKMVSQMTNQMDDLTREQLGAMGLQVEEITDQMAYFQLLDRAGARTRRFDAQQQAEAAADLTKNMLTLAKLTGEDVESMQEKLAAQQADVAFQMRLAEMGPEQRQKIQQGLADATALYGEVGAQYFKQQVLGFPPLTQETQMFAATLGESADAVRTMANAAIDATTFDEFKEARSRMVTDMLEAQRNDAEKLRGMLMATGAGLESNLSGINDVFNSAKIRFTDYVNEFGELDVEAAFNNIDTAFKDLPDETDELVKAMSEAQDAFYDAGTRMEKDVIGPLINAATPMIEQLTGMTNDLTESDAFDEFFNQIRGAIDGFSNLAEQGPGAVMEAGIKQLWEHPTILGAMVLGIGTFWAQGAIIKAMVGGIGKLIAASMAGDILSDVDIDRNDKGRKSRGRMGRMTDRLKDMFGRDGPGGGGNRWSRIADRLKDFAKTSGATATRTGANLLKSAPGAAMQVGKSAIPVGVGAAVGTALGAGGLIITPNTMADGTLPANMDVDPSGTSNRAIEHLQQMSLMIDGLQDKIDRSLSGENVFTGFEKWGRNRAQEDIDTLINEMKTLTAEAGLTEGDLGSANVEQVQQLVESLNTNMNDINRGSQAEMRELNTIMREVLGVLQEQKDIDDKIQRNTSGITGNIARGRVSNVGR